MNRTIVLVGIVFVLALLATSCGLLQEPEEASAPISVTPIQQEQESVDESQEEPAQDEMSSMDGEMSETSGDSVIYQISQEESEVRFELDEDLRGQRITVVGVTDQVSGEIAMSMDDLSDAQVGVILINARTVSTDNNFRNRAIQNEILDTGEFEYITFEPTKIDGLPGDVGVGEEVSFTMEGNLTVRDITNPVTFTVVAAAETDTRISGTASAVINRSDYGLTIPSVPNVANVEEEVEIYLDFVAVAK